jgi:3-isopropylmalate/(R)-2-methylmalate dehydratase small subunit
VQSGDVIVGGRNFGCGSSREHAPLAIKAAGVSCVIAESFARIFYRNAINIGLPIIESSEAARAIQDGDIVEIDFDTGKIKVGIQVFTVPPFPPFIQEIITAGGLMNRMAQK